MVLQACVESRKTVREDGILVSIHRASTHVPEVTKVTKKEDTGVEETLMIMHSLECNIANHAVVVHLVDLQSLLLVATRVCGKEVLLLDSSRECLGKSPGLREVPLKAFCREEAEKSVIGNMAPGIAIAKESHLPLLF